MSSDTPTMNAATPPIERAKALPRHVDRAHEMTDAVVYHPKRSSLVSWTVRAAQVADRIVTRAFPASGVTCEPTGGLVAKTLNGLDRCCRLIPAHQGVVAAERVRLSIQQVRAARHQRYCRFEQLRQTMRSGTATPIPPGLSVHLNPVCRWMRTSEEPVLERQVLERQESLSGSILFFLANNDIHGLQLNLEGQALINELADYHPCTIFQWAQLSLLADAGQLTTLVHHLGEIGLVAWGDE